MEKITIIQRLGAETPVFWKRVQTVFLLLSVILGYLFDAKLVPAAVFFAMAGFFGGIAAIAQLAVKDATFIKQAIADPLSIIDYLSELRGQVQEVKQAVTNPVKVTLDDVSNTISKVEMPAAAEITVNAPEASPVNAPVTSPIVSNS